MHHVSSFTISDSSLISEVRRHAVTLAGDMGFDETAVGKVALLITEMASNLVKHVPQGGELLVKPLEANGITGLEMLSLDQGDGIANIGAALRDGYSTAGSRGVGLGAMQRLSHHFDIYSAPGKGTAILTRLWSRPQPDPISSSFEWGGFSLAKPGQMVCGDGWDVILQADGLVTLVVDGLGHGPEAARAAQEASQTFRARPHLAPDQQMNFLHGALRHTRGAAASVAQISLEQQSLFYVGIGNISGYLISEQKNHHLVSLNGTVGHTMRKIQAFTYPWLPGSLLILCSDGLTTRWNLEAHPGLINRHPALVAGVLYRDHKRGNDDVTVVVIKQRDGT